MPRVVKFIESEERVGKGVEGDPVRIVRQLFTLRGGLVASLDPFTNEQHVTGDIVSGDDA